MAKDQGTLYPGFNAKTGTVFRLQRLETGAPRLRRGQASPTVGQYSRIPRDILRTGNIDTTRSTVLKKGGVPPSANRNGFAYTSTANSITWYWDGTNGSTVIVIKRSDSTNQVIPTAGSGLTVTGLLNTTTYYFLPFWSPNNLCNIGWVPGTIGTPRIAFVVGDTTGTNASNYLLQQTLQDREALIGGFMSATTGSSGGGGGHGCVKAGTEIAPCGDGKYEIQVLGEQRWIRVEVKDGRWLFCTYDHPLYREDEGRTTAETLEVGMALIMDDGVREIVAVDRIVKSCSKWKIEMPDGHLYYANGFLSHNQKPLP